MTQDRRLTPANGMVAALRLKGRVASEQYTEGEAMQVVVPVAPLWRAPGGPRERELLYGEAVTVYDTREGFAFAEAARDGFVGYLDATAVGPVAASTHAVAVPATLLFAAPDLKHPDALHLSFGARLAVEGAEGAFLRTSAGRYVPASHLRALDAPFGDPAAVAEKFLGVPYLWGGNSILGLDCSGLVQAALLACDIPCPGDSDLQEAALGAALAPDAPLRRNDLVFWKGHVAIALDPGCLIHANGHSMSVAREEVGAAIARIESQGGGPVSSRRRLPQIRSKAT